MNAEPRLSASQPVRVSDSYPAPVAWTNYGNPPTAHQERSEMPRKKSPASLTPYLTLQQVAERLNVTDRTVRKYVSSGHLPAYRLGSRDLRFRLEDVENLLRPVPTTGNAAS